LIPIGLDLSFEVNRLAAPSLKSALKTNFENILESIKLRNSVSITNFPNNINVEYYHILFRRNVGNHSR
jgi:hypothetical protein